VIESLWRRGVFGVEMWRKTPSFGERHLESKWRRGIRRLGPSDMLQDSSFIALGFSIRSFGHSLYRCLPLVVEMLYPLLRRDPKLLPGYAWLVWRCVDEQALGI